MTKEVIVAALTAVGVFGALLLVVVCDVTAFTRDFDDEENEEEDD